MHHAGPEDLHPPGLLARGAADAPADLALHVHFGRGLGERKERRPEPDTRVGGEEAAGERREGRLEVDEGDPLVHGEAFDLLEHRRVGRVERVAAIHLSRDHDADGGRIALERPDLHR